MKVYSLVIVLFLSVFYSGSCDRGGSSSTAGDSKRKAAIVKFSSLDLPKQGAKFTVGDEINVAIQVPDTLAIDSVEAFFRGSSVGIYKGTDEIILSTKGLNPGFAGIRMKVHLEGRKPETHSRKVELLSDLEPIRYRYRVVNSFPHDISAYTQGLIYYDGWLYEGTGNLGQSSVRKVRLQNVQIIQIRSNSKDIFGEGITIFNGKIYQLTYKAQICYVYDLNSFEEIQKFYYQNKEGWGLTNNENELIMSDGSNILYFIDPNMFTVKRQIEVYNKEGPVRDLNELEYIEGKIYANRYYTDEIVIIDPQTGKEEGRVDMKGILPVKDRKPTTNVLNGIAWDKDGNRLFVTGKYWPKLYQIELIKTGAGL